MTAVGRVEIGVSDLERSRRFYEELLGLEPPPAGVVELVEIPDGTPSGWVPDNAQRGIRHVGLKVADTDAHAERLRAAGVEFMIEPFTAVGGGRIAFFGDPDGTQLELVAGTPDYHRTWSDELAARERGELPGPDEAPRFDHVAITVEELDAAIPFYRDRFGIPVIGQLFQDGGRTLTFFEGLELFSFDGPTSADPRRDDPRQLGFRGIWLRDGSPLPVAP
jgi:catechol 2,3-dioxygenase-like lactoylglutathione lyase family enzyme